MYLTHAAHPGTVRFFSGLGFVAVTRSSRRRYVECGRHRYLRDLSRWLGTRRHGRCLCGVDPQKEFPWVGRDWPGAGMVANLTGAQPT